MAASPSGRGLTLGFPLAPCSSAETSHGLLSALKKESGALAARAQALTYSVYLKFPSLTLTYHLTAAL